MVKKNNIETIVLCEFLCTGFEHVPFNSAYLLSLLNMYPDTQLLFVAEKKHAELIKDFIERNDQKYLPRIIFRLVKTPSNKCKRWQRTIYESFLLFQLVFITKKYKTKFLSFCSTTESLLLNIIIFQKLKIFSGLIYIVFHSILDEIRIKPKPKIWNFFYQIPYLLQNYQRDKLKFVILGQSIFESLLEKIEIIKKDSWICINLPCIWEKKVLPTISENKTKPFCFGYLGTVKNGFEDFLDLACLIKKKYDNQVDFILNGFHTTSSKYYQIAGNFKKYIKNIENNLPVDRKLFNENANKITYVIGCYDKEHYTLTASATFLDSLSLLIPGIHKRNRYVEYYFNKFGEVGYLYDDYDELVKIVEEIINSFSIEKYKLQIENIFKNRNIFAPERCLYGWK